MDGILFVRKPKGMTSFDVVNSLRHTLKTKKIGHTGTLDPQAEGMLIVMLGNCTKILPYIKNDTKEYVASLQFKVSSDTEDIFGSTVFYEEETPDLAEVKNCIETMTGTMEQIPPMVSAIKVNGKKLYEYAREGKEIERKPRTITITEMEFLSMNNDTAAFRCVCSAGTYIRSLCTEIGHRLGVHAVMSSLIRTRIDEFDLTMADTLEDISEGRYHLHTKEELLNKRYPIVYWYKPETIKNGKRILLQQETDETVMIA
ncbi:MAG: tRNA pseudouridine(55) synthase TruB, partial [Erysipelotrichaceae bacterium]|nr:tRNA pseudouridine(55) synthase TruB [Erysipelotrichaceae bacterium]